MVEKNNNNNNLHNEVIYRMGMYGKGISKYNPIGKITKILGYSLIGYGVVTCWLPSGSQLALLGGCALLGIPFSKVWGVVRHYIKKVWFVVRVMTSKRRIIYEVRRIGFLW